MTYARKKAHEAQDRWLNNGGGHAVALEAVEAVIASVVEDCARLVEKAYIDKDKACADISCPMLISAAMDIRSLLSPDTKGQP